MLLALGLRIRLLPCDAPTVGPCDGEASIGAMDAPPISGAISTTAGGYRAVGVKLKA
ncbi:hypothetical protein BDZ89DRAFT_1060811 [Hymenopellis radicata]|nr:hypothetical protein BDZ89DRAFT_1060811 [Hymenopellis radicata]